MKKNKADLASKPQLQWRVALKSAKCTVLPQAGRKEPSPCRQTCWPTYIWAPAWKMRDKLLTRLLKCFKGHMCCFLWRKNLSTCLWNWTSSGWPRITLSVNNQSPWERFSNPNWWIGAKWFVIPSLTKAHCFFSHQPWLSCSFASVCEPEDMSHKNIFPRWLICRWQQWSDSNTLENVVL